jgi:drug/metabolite transporter (DMT)-like permease
MLTVLLGFAASVVYGFADFFGGLATRKINAMMVTLISGLSGFFFLLLLSPWMGLPLDSESMFWGIMAGLFACVAVTALYASLAIGPIAILSPLGAIVSALVPMGFGLFFRGESFTTVGICALLGIVVAVGLVGFVPGADIRLPSVKGLTLGLVAGMSIGGILICVSQAPADSGLTPIVFLRGSSAVIMALIIGVSMLTKRSVASPEASRNDWWVAILAGVLDASANMLFLNAMRTGELTIVAVLTALYPLGTIILARVILHEKIAKIQLAGVLLALSCSALLASGL